MNNHTQNISLSAAEEPEDRAHKGGQVTKQVIERKYLLPFILITSLFFMWGFARATLDVLNKHFQELMSISIAQSSMIQFTTYLGYFLMAIPAGIIITRFGYRRGVVAGLLLFAIGSLLFIPGDATLSFAIFLIALFVIGCGLVILETAANPYAAVLGSPETAASRLNFTQSFNGLGCILAPIMIGSFLFSNEDARVAVPYAVMGVLILIAALIFSRIKLPEINSGNPENSAEEKLPPFQIIRKLLADKGFCFGLFALFCYEISEISINSLFINYTTADGWMDKTMASVVLSFGALGLFMVARISGSWIMSRIKAEKVLAFCGIATVVSALLVAMNIGGVSKGALFACYAFEAIMFPTIFSLAVRGLGRLTKSAGSVLMMTPVGGCGFLLMGIIADRTNLVLPFISPLVGFTVVLCYAAHLSRQRR